MRKHAKKWRKKETHVNRIIKWQKKERVKFRNHSIEEKTQHIKIRIGKSKPKNINNAKLVFYDIDNND